MQSLYSFIGLFHDDCRVNWIELRSDLIQTAKLKKTMKKLYNLSIKIYTQKELLRHCILKLQPETNCYMQNIHTNVSTYDKSIKPFGKWLSPSAEMPNLSESDFRHARKHQTIREMTFAECGNAKPFGKWLSPCAETSNYSGKDFRHARKKHLRNELREARKGYKRKKHSEEMNLQSAL